MKNEYQYDVALSYAGEDREYVERVAVRLTKLGIKVFYDGFLKETLLGKDLYQHLGNIYQNETRYAVIFISRNYTRKLWTQHELKFAQARAFKEPEEYILPARLDDSELPGLPPTTAYIDLGNVSPEEFAELLARKIAKDVEELKPAIEKKISETEPPDKEIEAISLPLILYSTKALLTFLINEKFYEQKHFIWAAPYFNIENTGNPRSSSPAHIYKELKLDTDTSDLHSAKIKSTKIGLLTAATSKKETGIINDDEFEEIVYIVDNSLPDAFRPIVYVIPTKGIENIIKEAPLAERANPLSKEYIIESLHRKYFDVLNIDYENIKI